MEYTGLINRNLLDRVLLYTIAIGTWTIMGYGRLYKAKLDILNEDFRSETMEMTVKDALETRELIRGLEIDRKRWEEESLKLLEEIDTRLEQERAESIKKLREMEKKFSEELDAEKERLKQFNKGLENSLR